MTEGNEHISGLMDDEFDSHSLKQVLNDEQLKQTWARYHLIGDCLRDTLPEKINLDISLKVSKQLESEPTILAPERKQGFSAKPVIGFAIAASVALVAVLGIKQNVDPATSALPSSMVATKQTPQPVGGTDTYTFAEPPVRAASIKTDTPATLANQRMSGYLVNHNQYRISAGTTGITPYVRIVTIETQE